MVLQIIWSMGNNSRNNYKPVLESRSDEISVDNVKKNISEPRRGDI